MRCELQFRAQLYRALKWRSSLNLRQACKNLKLLNSTDGESKGSQSSAGRLLIFFCLFYGGSCIRSLMAFIQLASREQWGDGVVINYLYLWFLWWPLNSLFCSDFISYLQDNHVCTVLKLLPSVYELDIINTTIILFGGHFSCWKYFIPQVDLIFHITQISHILIVNSSISTSRSHACSDLKLRLTAFDILDIKIMNSWKLFSGWFVCLYIK